VQKSVLFRGGADVKSDERASLVYRVLTMPVLGSTPFSYPKLLALHRLAGDEGTAAAGGADIRDPNFVGSRGILLPASCPLTADSLTSDGVFLLFDGVETFLWFGRAVSPGILEALFGCTSLEGVDMTCVACALCVRVHACVSVSLRGCPCVCVLVYVGV
jgi:protein transport protein SEC24